jgi:hypothetical protein
MGGYCIRIGAGKVNKNRLARFSRRIRAERGERCERCGREGGVELHHFWEKHIYPMLGASGRLAQWACPARGLEVSGADVRKQRPAAKGREHSQKRETRGFTLKATEGNGA